MNAMEVVLLRGGCHCRAVRFDCSAPQAVTVWICNCSICGMRRNDHFIIPNSSFRLAEGSAAALRSYRFGSRAAEHLFCGVCGVTAFYRPRSNPDGVAVTLACVDAADAARLAVTSQAFDGLHWEAAYAASDIAACSAVGGGGGSGGVVAGIDTSASPAAQ